MIERLFSAIARYPRQVVIVITAWGTASICYGYINSGLMGPTTKADVEGQSICYERYINKNKTLPEFEKYTASEIAVLCQ